MRAQPEQIFVLVRAPNGDLREFPVGDVSIVIGRDESADIRVEDRKVSRRHAAFRAVDGQLWIEDLGSVNGVKLNGKKVSGKAVLLSGDVLHVGAYEVSLKPSTRQVRASRDGPPDATVPPAVIPRTGERSGERSVTATPRLLLIGQGKPVAGRRFSLGLGENIVGRLEDCAVPILDGSVSRQHAKLLLSVERASVIDLASSNGSFVNGVRVDSCDLTDGDRLKFGSVEFRVELSSEVPSRVGPIEPSRLHGARQSSVGRSRAAWAAGGAVLLVAIAVLGVAAYRSGRLPASLRARLSGLGGKGHSTTSSATATAKNLPPPAVKIRAELPLVAKVPSGASGVSAPSGSPPAWRPPTITEGKAPPPIAALRTSTSPYTRRDPKGLIADLPPIDEVFDFDAFVGLKLGEAATLETAGKLGDLKVLLDDLLLRDPINRDARQIQRRLALGERVARAIEEGDKLRAEQKLKKALEAYSRAPAEGPRSDEAKQRIAELKPVVIKKELEAVEKEIKKKTSWTKAHHRLATVLTLDPENTIAKLAIGELESKLREARIEFEPFNAEVPGAPSGGGAPAARKEQIAQRYDDRSLRKIASAYADGELSEAIKRAEVSSKRAKGPRKQAAKDLLATLKKLEAKYERVRHEVANDPSQAWAHLMEFQKMEREILPETVKSYLVSELEQTIADAFAERGTASFEQEHYELAFQHWDAGFKLNPANPKIVVGLKKLEAKAEKYAEDAELAGQRGSSDVCDRWRKITRMTRSESETHRKARERLQSCR